MLVTTSAAPVAWVIVADWNDKSAVEGFVWVGVAASTAARTTAADLPPAVVIGLRLRDRPFGRSPRCGAASTSRW